MEDLTKVNPPKNLPWLLFSNHYHFLMGKFSSNGPRRVLDFSTREERHVDFPETKGNIICGTSSGWLILIDDKSLTNITLVNPITVTKHELPRIPPEQNRRFPVHKAILSSNPNTNPNDYVVLVIYGDSKELRFYKSGRDTWTTLKETGRFWDDIISDGGKFYAVNEWGRVVSLKFYNADSSSSFFDPLIEEIAMPWSFRGSKVYISMIDGQLCMILRFVRQDKTTPDGFATTGFEVYEYISTKEHWKELFTLNGGCLFVGRNETLSLSGSSSLTNSFTANKIFFTDDYDDDYRMRCGRDVGEYLVSSVRTKAIRRPFDSIQLPEIWFMPSA